MNGEHFRTEKKYCDKKLFIEHEDIVKSNFRFLRTCYFSLDS